MTYSGSTQRSNQALLTPKPFSFLFQLLWKAGSDLAVWAWEAGVSEHVRVGPQGLGISLMGSPCARAAGGEEGVKGQGGRPRDKLSASRSSGWQEAEKDAS